MLLLIGVVVGLIIGLLWRGQLANLGQVTIRLSGLIFAALLVQIVIFSDLPAGFPWLLAMAPILYIASLVAILIALWVNRHLPGVRLLLLGSLLNALVITANGGQMPRAAPLPSDPAPGIALGPFTNTKPIDSSTWLTPLGDVIEVPFRPDSLISVGDVAIAVGAAWFVVGVTRPRRTQVAEVISR
jgi:hypothetical protein